MRKGVGAFSSSSGDFFEIVPQVSTSFAAQAGLSGLQLAHYPHCTAMHLPYRVTFNRLGNIIVCMRDQAMAIDRALLLTPSFR